MKSKFQMKTVSRKVDCKLMKVYVTMSTYLSIMVVKGGLNVA